MFFYTRTAIGIIFWDIALRRLGLARIARRTRPTRYLRFAQRYRKLAVELGGVWIKVGQFLSARVDVLPEYITTELAGLQDEVPEEPTDRMRAVIESEFGRPVDEIFENFHSEALASASLGQVHRAKLPSGEEVVVKIQRPGIDLIIGVDLRALKRVIGWLKRYRAITRRADLDAIYEEFSRTLWAELDYLAEGENARTFAEMFADDRDVRIPDVHDQFTTKRVLTLEDVYFIKITDYAQIEAAGIALSDVASRLFNSYLGQIFHEGFFHADPHPGNLFVEPVSQDEWRLIFVDFGMVGALPDQAKEGLRDLAVAIGTRNIDRLMRAYQKLQVLLPTANLDRIREAEEIMWDRFWGRSMSELRAIHPREMRQMMHQFRDVMYEMPFQMPTDLIFLGRCIAILSGMCTGLDPDFNLFAGLAPFARELVESEDAGWWDQLLEVLVEQGKTIVTLPSRLDATLQRIESGSLMVTARAAPELDRSLSHLIRSINRLVASVVFSVLLLVGSLLYVNDEKLLGGIGLGLGLLAALFVLRR
jgi:predicted unusual protein kinase regulating ubiquinone biosynthesis (AarF/ABC1/UbiB family)